MKISFIDGGVLISETKDFDVARSCECGQCFRFYEKDGDYVGVVQNKAVTLSPRADGCFMPNVSKEDFEAILRPYFDLDRDYDAIVSEITKDDDVMRNACLYGRGIRLFRQDTWETLISFIISQNNNIPRIKGIISRLCAMLGSDMGNGIFAFPTPKQMQNLTADDLAPLRAGFRAKYIIDAVKKVNSGEVDLKALPLIPYPEAKASLMKICGVGPKVADCVLLFSASHLEAFPVDVWIKRALKTLYPQREDTDFGRYGGIAQQYLFVYARKQIKL